MRLRGGKNLLSAAMLAASLAAATVGQKTVSAPTASFTCLNKIDASSWAAIIGDVRATAPEQASRLETETNYRQRQIDALRQVLAFQCQAVKDGLLADAAISRELKFVHSESVAMSYDRFKNKANDREPLSDIADAQVERFYQGRENIARFERFAADRSLTGLEEIKRERAMFARIVIAEKEYLAQESSLPEAFRKVTEIKAALEQAQFLSHAYGGVLAGKIAVTENEINAYIAAHSELNSATKLYTDPDDPNAAAVPVRDYVREKLRFEKETAIIAKVLIENPIVIEDRQASPVRQDDRRVF